MHRFTESTKIGIESTNQGHGCVDHVERNVHNIHP